MELSLSTLKDATKLVPASDDEFGGSLAWLHKLAWKCENPSAFFRSHQVQRDADRAEAQVPAKITTLGWEKEPTAQQGTHAGNELVPFLLRMLGVSSIYVREDYEAMLQEIIDVAVNGLPKTTSNITVNTDNQVYNPFIMPMSVPAATIGAIVTGSPGIGKSTFLIYILVLRLFAGQTTVIQWSPDMFYVVNSEGVFSVPHSILAVYKLQRYVPRGTWFLFDSNRSLEDVPESFVTLCKAYSCFLVQAASPRTRRVEWTKKVNAQQFWMAPWSLGELIAGRDVQMWRHARKPTEKQLASFCAKFGTSANIAYIHAAQLAAFERENLSQVSNLSEETIRRLLHGPTGMTMDEDISHLLVVTWPDPLTHLDYSRNISTQYLSDMVLEHLGGLDRQAALRLYWLFLIDSHTRGFAGYYLEKAFLEQFPRGGQWPITKMRKKRAKVDVIWNYVEDAPRQYLRMGYENQAVEILDERVHASGEDFFLVSHELPPVGKVELQDGFFIPKAQNQASYDSFAYNDGQNHIVLFQVTVSPNHDTCKTGLDRIPQSEGLLTDLVVVTCPKKYNGAREITMDLGYSDKINSVYHLELAFM